MCDVERTRWEFLRFGFAEEFWGDVGKFPDVIATDVRTDLSLRLFGRDSEGRGTPLIVY